MKIHEIVVNNRDVMRSMQSRNNLQSREKPKVRTNVSNKGKDVKTKRQSTSNSIIYLKNVRDKLSVTVRMKLTTEEKLARKVSNHYSISLSWCSMNH